MSTGEIALICVGCTIALLLILLFVGGYVTFRMAFYHNPKKKKIDPYMWVKDETKPTARLGRELVDRLLPMPYEDIYTDSHDGLCLHAKLYIVDESAPFVIMCHGYKSASVIDFAGGGPDLMERGFNGIMIDERATGESSGRVISFGYNESLDILRWIDYVRNRWGEDRKILLCGVSMGAASVIMAAGRGLPENVLGVLADCPYSSARGMISKVISEMKLPPAIFYPLVRFGGIVYGGFDVEAAEPRKFAAKVKVPITVIHGEADGFVPSDMSREIAEESPLITLHTFPDAGHGTSYLYDRERYRKIVSEFIESTVNLHK